MHSIRNNLVISTKESVYWGSSFGKLEENSLVETVFVPLQKRFYGDCKACLPIGINDLPAIAFEERIVGTMSFANSTAVAAPFARMPTIDNFKNNVFVKASAFEQLPESIEGNAHNLFIKSFSFWGKSFEFFNRNVSVILQSHSSNFFDDFAKPVFYKVFFAVFQDSEFFSGFETAFVGEGLQQGSAQHYFFAFCPNIFSKIGLFKDFSVGRKNRNGKAFAVDINSKNIFSLRQFGFLLGQICDNLQVKGQAIGFTLPAVGDERGISLKVPILFDWNWQMLSGIHSKFNEEVGFGVEGFAVSGDIEFNSNSLNSNCFASDNIAFNVADYLAVEGSGFLAC